MTSRGIMLMSRSLLRSSVLITNTSSVRCYKRWVSPTLKELQRRKKQMPEQKPLPRSSYLEWNYNAEIYAFSHRLGEKFDNDLLKQALTHKSYTAKQQLENPDTISLNNEDMIKAGEEIINAFLEGQHKDKYPVIIQNAIQSYLTNDTKLAYIASHIGLTDLIFTEEYPPEESTLANTFKALISALEQSSSLDKTHKFLEDFLLTQLTGLDVFDIWEPAEPFNYLSNSLLKGKQIEPRLCNQSGMNTILANYQVGLYSYDKKLLGIGWGESVKNAKDSAALDAIRKIYQL